MRSDNEPRCRRLATTAGVQALTLPALACALLAALACGGVKDAKGRATVLAIGAYTTPREAYGEDILPAFANEWRVRSGSAIAFEESYLGSGAQARAIAGGFEADVAALSLEPDLETLVRAGLITSDWKKHAHGGMVSRSIVVIAVRPGNPRKIRDWADLGRPGMQVLTPNPRTSGGAMWNIAALYGAALRSTGPGRTPSARDSVAAESLLRDVLANVSIMDKGARESILTFENGAGDAAITYENEVIAARRAGQRIAYVIPRSTILIENPVAVIDAYVDARGTREVAEAFVRFLATPGAQRMFARHGFRPADDRIAGEYAETFPEVEDLFTVADLGGWSVVTPALFGETGVFSRAASRPSK